MSCILILIILNLRTSELGGSGETAEPVNEINFIVQRLAGRVIENPLVSVTIDVLTKCSPSFRANGGDRENGVDEKVGAHTPNNPM